MQRVFPEWIKMVNQMQILGMLNDGNRDISWLNANMQTLRREFSNQFVAVKGEQVVAWAPNMRALLLKLRKKSFAPRDVSVEFISDVIRIL